jgi:hypothetical protein
MAMSFRDRSSTTTARNLFSLLETEESTFDYAPATIPPQGGGEFAGIDCRKTILKPETILKRVYYENSARILRI